MAIGLAAARNDLRVVMWTSRLKRARRVEGDAFAHPTTSFTLHGLPPGIVPSLLSAARREG
jgi:hypothetical protein